jgi:Tol biopolymer transport system component
MSLTAGTRLGPYEIAAPIGAGGMGEVYRAVDTRLKRAVALKVLPAAFRNDADRLARFEREAELLAALNHPNIAQIYGVEDAGGVTALVMELADGPTLADRIAQGAMPADEALPIARQVLDALDSAHDRGIVHRDLKPANIKVQPHGTVKVLDFGLAKALDATPSSGGGSGSATITSPALTAMGMILGTAAYMSPEQAKGRAVDRRADLWAFGCVLFEMLTGSRAFGGDDVTDTLANVLKSDANLRDLPASVPARVRQVIVACLQKDPRQRLASAQDVRLALDGAFESTAPAFGDAPAFRSPWHRLAPYFVGAIVAALVVSVIAWRLAPAPEPGIVGRFDVDIPEGQDFRSAGRPVMAVSPDGRSLVYNAVGGLRVRGMADLEARIIPGTEAQLTNPFYSPDGQHVAFFTAPNDIKRIALAGGAATVIVKGAENPLGAHWAEDGTILMAFRNGIVRVSETGGTPELIVKAGPDERLAMPQLLPGGDAVLFTAAMGSLDPTASPWSKAQIVAHSLRTGERTVILQTGRDARYLPTGHLAYVVEDTLFAVQFDPARLAVHGASTALVQGMWSRESPGANWGVSRNGALAYVPDLPSDSLRPVWVRRDGAVGRIDNLAGGTDPRLSPEGRRLLLEVDNDIWIYDLETGRRNRVTSGGASRPGWDPTGTKVAYSSGGDIWIAPADGNGPARRVTEGQISAHVDSWSPDGKTLAFHRHPPGNAPNEILAIEPEDPAPKPRPLVQRAFDAENAVFSPDGRYVAYISAETGGREIFIQQFPGPGPQIPVSVGGGREPVWARNGELFYRNTTGERMMVVKVTTSPSLVVGTPKELFQGTFFVAPQTGSPRPQYDVTSEGQRIIMLQVDRTARPQIVVVQNWFEEVRRLLPAK